MTTHSETPSETRRMTDTLKNVWIFRNPSRQSESVEVRPYSVPLDERGYAAWDDVVRLHGR